jgi:hypothetical protein
LIVWRAWYLSGGVGAAAGLREWSCDMERHGACCLDGMTHTPRLLRTSIGKILFGLAAATCVAITSTPARADDDDSGARRARSDDDDGGSSRRDNDKSKTHIALDVDFATAIDAPVTKAGGGGALRLGQEFDLLLISLTPEFGGSYHAFGGDDETKLYAGFLGGRLAIGKIVEPSLFAHVGVGHVKGLEETRTAPMIDGGLAIDFTLLPLIDLGLHGAYNVLLPGDDASALKYVTLGAHVALVL